MRPPEEEIRLLVAGWIGKADLDFTLTLAARELFKCERCGAFTSDALVCDGCLIKWEPKPDNPAAESPSGICHTASRSSQI